MKSRFISANQVEMFLKRDDHVLVMFASLRVESKVVVVYMLVVCEFSDIFLEDISDLSSEHEVEFAINLVHGTIPVSMASYRRSVPELRKLKKQLEELLEKKFVTPSMPLQAALVLLVKEKRQEHEIMHGLSTVE